MWLAEGYCLYILYESSSVPGLLKQCFLTTSSLFTSRATSTLEVRDGGVVSTFYYSNVFAF